MASQYDDQNKTRSGYPAMGYPPTAAPPGVYGYAYSVPPPAAYNTRGHPTSTYDDRGGYDLVRRIGIGVTAALVFTAVLAFLLWFSLRPRDPIIKIERLSVSNFTIVDSKLNADWDLSFGIWNPNRKYDMKLKEIDVLLFYRRNLLSTTPIKPFWLEKSNGTTVNHKLETREDFVEDDMEEAKKTGFVVMSLRMRLSASFHEGDVSTNDHKMSVFCEYLRMDFDGDTGNGKLSSGSWICLLYEV